jgi:predicted O-methyltransferase YrrM
LPRESDCHPHVPAERAELFECYNGGATEVEYLELLYAIVRATKPQHVLETGCFDGRGTRWLAHALSLNGFGMLHSIDLNERMLAEAQNRVDDAELTGYVDLMKGDTREMLRTTSLTFGVAFFDSSLSIRADEAAICLDRGLTPPGSVLAFHDTSRLRITNEGPDAETSIFWKAFEKHVRPRVVSVMEFPLSRGLVIARV